MEIDGNGNWLMGMEEFKFWCNTPQMKDYLAERKKAMNRIPTGNSNHTPPKKKRKKRR